MVEGQHLQREIFSRTEKENRVESSSSRVIFVVTSVGSDRLAVSPSSSELWLRENPHFCCQRDWGICLAWVPVVDSKRSSYWQWNCGDTRPVFNTAPASSKNEAHIKSGQNWPKNNRLATYPEGEGSVQLTKIACFWIRKIIFSPNIEITCLICSSTVILESRI